MTGRHRVRAARQAVAVAFVVIFAFAVFGYVTATLATFFVGRDADSDEGEVAGEKSINAMRSELEALRREVQGLRADLASSPAATRPRKE